MNTFDCPKCGAELCIEDNVEIIGVHNSCLDIIISCKFCEAKFNDFIRINGFLEFAQEEL